MESVIEDFDIWTIDHCLHSDFDIVKLRLRLRLSGTQALRHSGSYSVTVTGTQSLG